jgi:hypothetical protein
MPKRCGKSAESFPRSRQGRLHGVPECDQEPVQIHGVDGDLRSAMSSRRSGKQMRSTYPGDPPLLVRQHRAAKAASLFSLINQRCIHDAHRALSGASQVDRLLVLRGVKNTDVFLEASMDGFTASRRTSNDPRPTAPSRSGVCLTFARRCRSGAATPIPVSPWEAGRAAAWRRDTGPCADPDGQFRCCLVAGDWSSNPMLAKPPQEQ